METRLAQKNATLFLTMKLQKSSARFRPVCRENHRARTYLRSDCVSMAIFGPD
jgi:hypothetical protein